MQGRNLVIIGLLSFAATTGAFSAERMQFWNLTATTITKLYLAPAGTSVWGSNQCSNDKDGAVDPDERLKLTGIEAGQYDVKLTDSNGRTCIVKGVNVQAGRAYAFSLSEAELKDCTK